MEQSIDQEQGNLYEKAVKIAARKWFPLKASAILLFCVATFATSGHFIDKWALEPARQLNARRKQVLMRQLAPYDANNNNVMELGEVMSYLKEVYGYNEKVEDIGYTFFISERDNFSVRHVKKHTPTLYLGSRTTTPAHYIITIPAQDLDNIIAQTQ